MSIDFLLEIFRANRQKEVIVWGEARTSYSWILDAVEQWKCRFDEADIRSGSVVSLEADFSPNGVALMLALVKQGCTIVPLTTCVGEKKPEFRDIAQVEVIIDVDKADQVRVSKTATVADHELLRNLKRQGRPGLVLFSSGSTGKNKAALHDFVPLLEKFSIRRNSLRAMSFLLFDHIGGINTLFYVLSNAGCLITVQDRSPESVCAAIEKHRVQLLPTSPTFINLLMLSEAYKRVDLSSLELVTYGAEVMPESTLLRFHQILPRVRLAQTYGLSEVGILRSKSKSSDSLWVKIGGEGFETRVVDGMLQVKAKSAMLGYLNAAPPFSEDGWFVTGDAVEVDGEYIRILGRRSEMINVGGEKVYPAEVESVLQLMGGVTEVVVSGEDSQITGQMVIAKIKLNTSESLSEFRKRMRSFCQDKLQAFKIPQKVVLVSGELHGERFKKLRAR